MSADLKAPKLYLNRELSWLSFNDRVLALSARSDIPLLERLKFVAIAASNLDEFFIVRLGSLERELRRADASFSSGPDGLSISEVLEAAHEKARLLHERMTKALAESLLPKLEEHGISFVKEQDVDLTLDSELRAYYLREVQPTLTPIAIDPSHPFPLLRSKSLNLVLRLEPKVESRPSFPGFERREGPRIAIVQVPSMLPRFVRFPGPRGLYRFVALETIIARYAEELFPGHAVIESSPFRLTRAGDLDISEDGADDLLSTIQDQLRRRDRGEPLRLEITNSASPGLTTQLLKLIAEDRGASQAGIEDPTVLGHHLRIVLHFTGSILAPSTLMNVYSQVNLPHLRDPSFAPLPAPRLRYAHSLFRAIHEQDILLHHPYETFRHVTDFIEQAAEDPDVVAIKQTLYRTSGDSPIVRALARAAEQGKDVTALVELKARFDEANNIAWARRLEQSGVHVVYGLIGLKTHCKMLLVTRREGTRLARYLHLGTGNYHPSTARLYTDLGIFTAREDMTHDAMILFNVLTGYAELPEMAQLKVAPFTLRSHILERIEIEVEHAKAGRAARIIAKMNSLVDGEVIEALYRASQVGVSIDLLVRGICCLRPGVPGISDNIRVRSVLDRFLEHARVFLWENGGEPKVYLSSADWMPRNLNRRIEVCFPVLDLELADRIHEMLQLELNDNAFAWRLDAGGEYEALRPGPDEPIRRSQATFIRNALSRSKREGSLKRPGHKDSMASPVMRVIRAQQRREKA